jgi:hypothetical protein
VLIHDVFQRVVSEISIEIGASLYRIEVKTEGAVSPEMLVTSCITQTTRLLSSSTYSPNFLSLRITVLQ